MRLVHQLTERCFFLGRNRFAITAMANDITVQREAELARESSEERVRQLVSRSDCMLWQAQVTHDGEGVFDWKFFIPDSELYRRVALQGASTPRLPWKASLVPEFPEMQARCRSAMVNGLPSYEQEFRYVRDGTVLWLHEQVMVRSTGTNSWVLDGVIINITSQREAEESRRASDAQLQRLMDAPDFLMWQARVFESQDGVCIGC